MELELWHGNCFKGIETKSGPNWNMSKFRRTKQFNKGQSPKEDKNNDQAFSRSNRRQAGRSRTEDLLGLFIPDNAKEKPMQGKVVAVGPGRKNDKGELVAMEVKVGDVVLYGKYSGTEVTVEGENYLIVKESDVIATL